MKPKITRAPQHNFVQILFRFFISQIFTVSVKKSEFCDKRWGKTLVKLYVKLLIIVHLKKSLKKISEFKCQELKQKKSHLAF
ncbi:hypothetical protein DHD05_06150 [Arenibacter sp. N53]|nr:hypothetical protein [Arenibacter sp. N53]